ncbi:DUF2786 domain-containing protein [Mycolicibacterium celeriflavum]|uniref:Uncharacterized protein n=1 Tax=Mycolicibacterium celeriflavum TaxID=1249101 RepID=A0A1X0C156_MYCCF|nr:DUF2786 domain-containing protein [Mycolicibacterium celeriflavum]MCV7238325.1 DUF2786 domain-containing protein [Mycolicibacterium celeriflavum]ORA50994.1 hypothetical protein BST21_02265 [Mycolicibacterium celeriflavum]BBY44868.1 hypothetical protein MCEL_31630 [Mycolicibacterium celeriflavum]
MSRRNREKRAAKQKDRRRGGARRERGASDPRPDRAALLERLVVALSLAATGPADRVARRAAELHDEYSAPDIDIAADIAVTEAIRAAWEHGWTPSDLYEIARRRLAAPSSEYLRQAIVLEARRYASSTLHPRWRAGLAAISAGIVQTARAPQMRQWAAANDVEPVEALIVVVTVLNLLGRLPSLEKILPLPGEDHHMPTAPGEVDGRALERVRALLAKAEATEFPDEAEALSAKAQELMSRYSLQEAVAHHDSGQVPVAAARRIWIDNPYAAAKASLVQAVGQANRCRVVWAQELGFVTVVGSETDLNLVEVLATSLLLQANRAMLAAGRVANNDRQTRTRSFRQSFLVAYAQRIGERLDTTSASVTAEINRDGALLPALAATSRAADELTARLFPSTVARAVSVSNGAGWGAGRAAADRAQLNVNESIAS